MIKIDPSYTNLFIDYLTDSVIFFRNLSTSGDLGKIVLTGSFNHETNTFSKTSTGIAEFEAYYPVFDEQILTKFRNVNHEQAGFIDCADQFGWKLVPTVVATANPGSTVTDEAFELYGGAILKQARSRHWDGIALPLHGAMVADGI